MQPTQGNAQTPDPMTQMMSVMQTILQKLDEIQQMLAQENEQQPVDMRGAATKAQETMQPGQ